MLLIQQIFSDYGEVYLQRYAQKMPSMQKKALLAIMNCRTKSLGGEVYHCQKCDKFHYSYHSCQNRHCVVCQNDKAQQWFSRQNKMRFPVPYFLSTFTLPRELRAIARSNQKLIYGLIFKASAEAMKVLARDKKYLHGEMGMIGILHTWTRTLIYHPHVHFLIPGLSFCENRVKIIDKNFLLPVKALSLVFRAKFRDLLKESSASLFSEIPAAVWKKDWVVHCKSVGNGEKALLYLSRYLFRVGISNSRIESLKEGVVTYKYMESKKDTTLGGATLGGATRYIQVSALEFIRRFLQHVLPHNFMKIRYYGFYAGVNRAKLSKIRHLLFLEDPSLEQEKTEEHSLRVCPVCGGVLYFIGEIKAENHARAP